MGGYLLDTNHLSAAIRLDPSFREYLRQRHQVGHRFGTCIPALCELQAGIQQTHRPDHARRRLAQLRRFVRLWPIDETTAQLSGELFVELQSRGRKLSTVDLILAAFARQMGLILLTTDRDFEALPDLKCEDWLDTPPAL